MLIKSIFPPRALRHTAAGLGMRVRVGVWMLVGLMLLATLAPAISRARAHGTTPGARGWVEVCTAHGMVWVNPDADAQHRNPRTQRAAAHTGLNGGWNGGLNVGLNGGLSVSLLQQLDACGLCALGIDRSTPPPDFSGWGLSLPLPVALPAVAGLGSGGPVRVALRARGPPDRT